MRNLQFYVTGKRPIAVMCPQLFCRVKFVIVPPCFVKQQYLWNIAIQPKEGCHNVWAITRCSGWSPLGENHCETWLSHQNTQIRYSQQYIWLNNFRSTKLKYQLCNSAYFCSITFMPFSKIKTQLCSCTSICCNKLICEHKLSQKWI